jgi:REase_DpnII-MboI
VIKDFSSAAGRFVVEAKYIRDKEHGRTVSKELHDDIEMYRTHSRCDDLIFFIYDPDGFVRDQRALRAAIEIERAYGQGGEKRLKCHLIVKP